MWKPLCVWDGPGGQAALNCKEALPAAFQHVWTLGADGRTEPLSFHDLGCGYGSLLVLAHVLKGTQNFNISTATGTEIRADLHDAFMRWLHDFQEAAPLFATAVDDIRRSFILADMISPDAVAVQTAVRQADIIWCNNMLFPPELNAAVANMLRQCMSARAVVVSTAELQCMEQGTPLELRTQNRFMFPPDSMSWTGNAVPGFMSRLTTRVHDHGNGRDDHTAPRRDVARDRTRRRQSRTSRALAIGS